MTELFLQILNMSLSASWLVLAVVLLRFVLKKAPKWVNVLLWGLVAIRLLCPFTLESALSLIPSAEVVSPEIMMDPTPTVHTGIDAVNSVVNPVITESFAPEPAASANPLQIWLPVASLVWCIGMALMLLYTVISYARLRYQVRTAIRVKDNIYISEFIDSPFVLGLWKPCIYLPFHMDERDRLHVLAHERAHIRRRDHWWKPIGFLLLTIHWFNPLMWLSYILLCRDIELACDEKVIRDLGTDQRADYSQALLHCTVTHRSIAACPIAFGEVGVKDRVKNVLNYKKPAFWVILLCLILVVIVSVCFLTNPETENAGGLPITMTLEYVNRSQAHLIFQYSKELPDGEFQIAEAYTLEQLVDGNWKELPRLREEQDLAIVAEVNNADYDAWSLPDWSEDYGRLPDGTYRIKKDISVTSDSGKTETRPIYAEFTIGGTAEDYLTLKLEDISPTGATLYQQETVEDTFDLTYDGNEGYWLESLQDGQWIYLDPTGYVEPIFENEKRYIYELYSSDHIELDWSHLYGELPAGTYRIAREVTYTGGASPRVCTIYAEFTVGSDWGLDLFIDRIYEDSITLNVITDDSLPAGEYFYVNSFLQVKERIGSWADVISIRESPKGQNILTESPSITLSWSGEHYQLTEGEHRIVIQIRHVLPDGTAEYNTFFEYFDPSTYAWGAALDVIGVSCTGQDVSIEYRQTFTKIPTEGSLSETAMLGLQKRENNQWVDFERTYGNSDLSDAGTINLSAYFGELPSGTYRLVRYVTRHFTDGTTDTRPIYASFAVDLPITLPNTLSSCIVRDGSEEMVTVTDPDRLERLRTLLASAKAVTDRPDPEDMTLNLTLTGTGGSTVEILLDWHSDICYMDGKYYDYGPGTDDNGSIDNRTKLFQILGISYTDPDTLIKILDNVNSDPKRETARLKEALKLASAHDNR